MLLPLRTYMKLGYWELFVVRAGGVLASYGVPVAGNIGVRLAYLRRRGLDYSQFAWATITSNVLGLAGAGALGLIALGMLWMRAGSVPVPVVALSAAVSMLALGGLAALGFLPRLAGHTRFQRWPWVSRMSGHEINRRTIVSVVVFSFGRHGFNFLSFGLLYQALLQAPGQFLNGGLVYAITTPIRIVSITPGNLGINEWVTAAVGMMLSFDVTTGLIVALVFRALSFAAQALGGLFAAAWLALRSGRTVKITVIIPFRNALPQLPALVSALERQRSTPDTFDVIWVDDASEDGGSAWLQERLPAGWRLLVQPERRGAYAARNAAPQGGVSRFRGFHRCRLSPSRGLD